MGESSSRDPLFQTAAERAASRGPSRRPPRILIIGAGQRGVAYATALHNVNADVEIAAVAEPSQTRRDNFGRRFVWRSGVGSGDKSNPAATATGKPREDQAFDTWADFVAYETLRRQLEAAGERTFPGVDAVFVCTLDRTHREIVTALAPLRLHVMCEKPMAATLEDCVEIYRRLGGGGGDGRQPDVLFSIGHVLRYSAHNATLRRLVLKERAIGDVVSVEHTEPVGWWHYSHSYVRGNWRREDTSGPSLMTKCCHDVDLLLWLLAYDGDTRESDGDGKSLSSANMPTWISSVGSLSTFTRARKPPAAGTATNCLDCAHEPNCKYSARRIYLDSRYGRGDGGWPVDVVVPDIEEIEATRGRDAAGDLVRAALAENYDRATAPDARIAARAWYGRCVWEADNDVMDEQVVTMQWEGDDDVNGVGHEGSGRNKKLAILHMAANTEAQCERRGRISGTAGEISYDSREIRVFDFASDTTTTHVPHRAGGGHGGGDAGLAGHFVAAVAAVINGDMPVARAQAVFIGCTLEQAFMSHAVVFAAEQARKERRSIAWAPWWADVMGSGGEKD